MRKTWMMDDEDFARAWDKCAPYTMTSPERGYALWQAIGHVARDNRPGSLVECGCWKGGSSMLMMLAAAHFGIENRRVIIFDTFEGMSAPDPVDLDIHDKPAADQMLATESDKETAAVWAYASLEDVKTNFLRVGLDIDAVEFIKGDIAETARKTRTGIIALLRLDTDFYASTKAEMDHLYNRLCPGGVLLIDDYGHWQGARKAVDEYFDADPSLRRRPMLTAVDYTGRIGIKPVERTFAKVKKYDQIPQDYFDPKLMDAFPSLVAGDTKPIGWRWLRQDAPHIWRTDIRCTRAPIGVVSYEEAMVLHNLARTFAGKRGLEIGCHFGWSTAHLVAAGLNLDVIDPALGTDVQFAAVSDSITAACGDEGRARTRLHPGFSPEIVPAIARQSADPWSFAFVDGLHDGEAPCRDVAAVLPFVADDAMVVMHDLLCPDVYAGLQLLATKGWQTRVLNTMQVMGVAWRGNVTAPQYIADPAMPVPEFAHLADRL